MNPAFVISSLNVWYGSHHALKDVSLDIPRGKIVACIGASGSGKSTLLRCLNRMIDTVPRHRTQGTILYGEQNILAQEYDVVPLRTRIGMVFQNPTPFPKSVYENVAYGPEIHSGGKKKGSIRFRFFKNPTIESSVLETSDNEIDQAVVRSLKEAALWEEVRERLHKSAYRLSGGQQQRLCIARALAVRPEALLLDEPCSALDPISTRKIEELLVALKERYTIVIVTHNLAQARRISDYVGFFHLGELVEFGETTKMFHEPSHDLTRAYVQGDFG